MCQKKLRDDKEEKLSGGWESYTKPNRNGV